MLRSSPLVLRIVSLSEEINEPFRKVTTLTVLQLASGSSRRSRFHELEQCAIRGLHLRQHRVLVYERPPRLHRAGYATAA